MGILNNLWIAISTPNEGLINVLGTFGIIVENFLLMYIFTSILNISPSKSKKFIFVFLLSIVGLFTMHFIPNPFNVCFNYFITIFIAYVIFNCSIFKIITSIVLSLLIFNLAGILILNPYITLFNLTAEQLNTILIYRLFYILIVYAITFLIGFIIRHKHLRIKFLENINKKTKLTIIINLLFGILALSTQTIILFYYVDNLPLVITFLSFIFLLAYFIISIYSLTRVFKLILTTQKLESAEAYNNTLHILHDNVRGFKHDFDNIVTTIGGYIRTEDMEGLKNYYLQLEDDCQRVNNLYVLNPDVVNNDGIYNLLTTKYYEADSKDIKVNITFLLDLSKLNMKIYEFARILGILLDNAIESSEKCKEKIINLAFRDDTKNSRQLIIIENTYKNKNVDTEKIFEKGFSEKENHTGLGLWEVKKLVKKNNNLNLYTTKDDKLFTQQLEIYY